MWQAFRHLLSSGFPYSEGIYDDVNKAIMLQLWWEPGRQPRDIIREYAAYEWSSEEKPLIEELFDLTEDPLEAHNLAGDPKAAHTLNQLRQLWEQYRVQLR